MPRLFIALRFPGQTVRDLNRLCQGLPGARWTASEDFHLTLRFIGETGNREFYEIGERLMDIRLPPFELRLNGLGHFPKRGALRQLWAGAEPSAELMRLKRRIDKVVNEAGIRPEGRKFTPHVTLARFQTAPSEERLASYLSRRQNFRTAPIPISSFELFSSHIRGGDAGHIVEADYDFVMGAMERA